jgi:hypothetical protein
VSVTQGATLLMRIPSRAHSQARLLASWLMAALLMAYRLPDRPASGPPATLEMNTMHDVKALPPPPPPPPAPPLLPAPAPAARAPSASSGCASWHST